MTSQPESQRPLRRKMKTKMAVITTLTAVLAPTLLFNGVAADQYDTTCDDGDYLKGGYRCMPCEPGKKPSRIFLMSGKKEANYLTFLI